MTLEVGRGFPVNGLCARVVSMVANAIYEGRSLVVLCTRRGCAVYKWVVVVEAGQEWAE